MDPNHKKILSPDQIKNFQEDGILVLPNILTQLEVQASTNKLHETLLKYGVDTKDLKSTGHNLVKLSSTNGSGGVLDLFYPSFKLDIATNENLFAATCELWEACFRNERSQISDVKDWMEHPFESFSCDRGYAYIDRIGFRLPSELAEEIGETIQKQNNQICSKNKKKRARVAIQRSLTPHLDCCPDTIKSSEKSKWRPIQCFVSLTDNLEPNTGGFEAVRGGFHKEFDTWAAARPKTIIRKNGEDSVIEISPPCVGEYTHIRPKEDATIMNRVEHIPVPAGSAVFWDNRIPHANSYKNNSDEARVVIYCSFLPDVEINRIYASKQLEDYNLGRIPRDQWIEKEVNNENESSENPNTGDGIDTLMYQEEPIDKNYSFTQLGKKLMMIDNW